MRKFNNIKAKRRITKKLQLLLISYLVMTQAVPTSLPSAVVAITAFAETIEHTSNSYYGGQYTVNGEEGKTYTIENNTDNSSVHANGNDITIKVNGNTSEVQFNGSKQDITINGNTESIQDKLSTNEDNKLYVTGDVVKSENHNEHSITLDHGSTATVGGSASVEHMNILNGSSLSTGYNNNGTSSGKSGAITVEHEINLNYSSNLKANGAISANSMNIDGNHSNGKGSNVEATGNVTAHRLNLSENSELVAKGVEVTKEPEHNDGGNIEVRTGSTIRTTRNGVQAETLSLNNSTVDSQKVIVGDTTVDNHSKLKANAGLNIKNKETIVVKDGSTVTVGDKTQNKSANLNATGSVIIQGNSSVDVNGSIETNVSTGKENSLDVNSSSVKASGNITSYRGILALNNGASVEAGRNIDAKRQIEANDSSLKAGGKIRGTNIVLSNSNVEADNIEAVADQSVNAKGYVQLNGAVNIKGNLSASNKVDTIKTAHELDETSNERSHIDGNVTGRGVNLRDTDVNGDIVSNNGDGTKGDVTIDNVEQIGNIKAERNVTISGNSTVNGDVTGSGTVTVSTSNIDGTTTGYKIDAYNSSVLHDVVGGSGGVKLSNGAKAEDVQSQGTVELYGLDSKGQATQRAQVEAQSITSDKKVTINHGVVHENVTSKSDLSIHDSSVGNVTNSNKSGNVEIDNSTTKDITNNANDFDSVATTTINNSTVNGNVETQHGATISGNTHITGNVNTTNRRLNIDGGDTGTVKIDGDINTGNDGAAINHAEIGGTINTIVLNIENSSVGGDINAEATTGAGGAEIRRSTVNGKVTANNTVDVYSSNTGDIEGQYVTVQKETGGSRNSTGSITSTKGRLQVSNTDVNGNITSEYTATVEDSTVSGDINAKKATTVKNSTVNGDVHGNTESSSTTSSKTTIDNSTVKSVSGDIVLVTEHSTVHGDVYGKYGVGTAYGSTIDGKIESDGTVSIDATTVGGDVTAAKSASFAGSKVNGDVRAQEVDTWNGTTINGSIKNAAKVVAHKQATINGDIESETVTFTSGDETADKPIAEVNGDIKANSVSLHDTRVQNSTHASTIEAHKGAYDASVELSGGSEVDNISIDDGRVTVTGLSTVSKINGTDNTHTYVHKKASVNKIVSGYATVDGNATVNDIDVTSQSLKGGTVSVSDNANVHDISGSAKSSITVKDNAVANDLQGGNVTASGNSTVHNITSVANETNKYIRVQGEATVTGDITAKLYSKAVTVVEGTAHTDNANIQNNGTSAVYAGGNSSDNYEHFDKLLEAGEIKAEDSASINSIKSENGNVYINTDSYYEKSTEVKGDTPEYIVREDLNGKTVTVDGKLLVGGDFKATTAKFNAGSEVNVLGNYTAGALDADNNTVHVKGNSNTNSIVAKDGNSAKVDGTATIGSQGITSDNGTVEVGELVIKQNTGNSDTNIQATNGGTITVNSDLDTTEAIASASKSGKGIKLEANGGNSVIHIKGNVSDTNKDNKSVGMNAVATNNGTIQIDGDAEGKYTADGGTVNISGTAKVKVLEADSDGTVSAKNGIHAETARSMNNSIIKSDGDIKINDLLTVGKGGAVTTDKKFIGSNTLMHKDGNLNAKEGIETETLSIGDLGGNTISTLGSIVADNIRSESSYDLGELGERNKVTANDTIKGAINTKSTGNFKRTGTDFESNKVEITGKSDMEDTNIKANKLTITAKDGAEPDMKMNGGVLDISGNIKIEGVFENSNSVAKISLNDTDVKIGGTVTSTVEGHSSQLEVNGGENNNSLVLRNGTDNVSVKTDRASADIKGDVTVANENESGAVQVKEGNLKLTDGNLVYTTSNNEEVKVNHGDIELSSKDAIQLIETGHDVVLLENYNVNSTGNGIAGSFEKLAIDDKSSLTAKGTGIRSLAETAEITAQTDVIGDEYGVESGSQLKYTTADSVIGGKAAFLKDDFTKQDDITVWEAKGEKVIDSKNGTATAEQIEKAEKEIKYVIKQSETENGTIEIIPTIGTVSLTGSDGVEKTYNVALQDQIVRVKIIPDTGYQVKSTSGRTAELKSVGDNIYELKVPRGGGVNISALMEAIPEIPNTPDKPSGGEGNNDSKGGNDDSKSGSKDKPSGDEGDSKGGNDKPSGNNDKPSGNNDNKPNTPSKPDKPSNNDNKPETPNKPNTPSQPTVPSYNYSDDGDSDDDYYSDNKSMEEHTAIDSSTPHKEYEETSLNTEVQQEIKNTESKVNEQINNAGNDINKIKEILAEETNAVKGTTVENNNKEIAVIDNHKTVEFGPSGIQVIESNSNNNYSAVVIEKSADGKVQCKDASGHAVSGIHVIITADSSDDSDTAPSGMICLFNTEGYMQTGWSILSDENYYYFSTLDGHMFINSLTPDGFTVNELGQWNGEASIYNADLKVPNAQSHVYTGTHTVQ